MDQLTIPPTQPVSPPPIQPPIQEVTKRKIPILLAVIFIFVIICILGGATLLMKGKKQESAQQSRTHTTPIPTNVHTRTSNIPANWKRYANATLLFSFRYPSEWEREGTQIRIPDPDCEPPHRCGGLPSSINIRVTKNEENIPLKDFIYQDELKTATTLDEETIASASARYNIQNYKKNTYNTDTKIESLINTKIPGAGSTIRVYYAKGNDIVLLQFESIDTATVNKILSSFLFDTKQYVKDYSTWQTYTDNVYYTVQYPQKWVLKTENNAILLYNPKSMTSKKTNGGATITYPKEFFQILSVTASSQKSYTYVQSYKKDWKSRNIDIKSELRSTEGIDLVIYDDAGEGSRGRNIAISDGTVFARLSASIKDLSEDSLENQILGSFQLLK